MKRLESAEDVTPRVLEAAEETAEWWGEDEKIDWERFIDRLAESGSHDNPPWDIESYDNPAVRKIQRHIRAHRRPQ